MSQYEPFNGTFAELGANIETSIKELNIKGYDVQRIGTTDINFISKAATIHIALRPSGVDNEAVNMLSKDYVAECYIVANNSLKTFEREIETERIATQILAVLKNLGGFAVNAFEPISIETTKTTYTVFLLAVSFKINEY